MDNLSGKSKNGKYWQDLMGSSLWFSIIFDGSLDAIFISDDKGFFVDVNKAAESLTGYSKQELLKMSIPDIHDPEDLKAYNDYFDRIMAGEDITSEAVIRRKDKSHVFITHKHNAAFKGNQGVG